MKRASFVVDPALAQDRIFDLENRTFNRDDCLYGFWKLREELRKLGYDLKTHDLHAPESSDLVLFNERPKQRFNADVLKKSVLMIFESALIRPDNWDTDFHSELAGVLTWHSELLKSPMYARGGFTHLFPKQIPDCDSTKARPKFCTLIAGNKSVAHPLELYTARRQAIRWFEKNAPQDFTYYGVGWERPYLKGGLPTKVLRKLNLLAHFPQMPSECFGGRVDSKLETLRQFEFSICFENARDIPGYISEKIFDSMFAGCIPVYWGAPDVGTFLPKEAYIDFREFKSYDELYRKLKSMPLSELQTRRNTIASFLSSEAAGLFDADRAAGIMARSITGFLR